MISALILYSNAVEYRSQLSAAQAVVAHEPVLSKVSVTKEVEKRSVGGVVVEQSDVVLGSGERYRTVCIEGSDLKSIRTMQNKPMMCLPNKVEKMKEIMIRLGGAPTGYPQFVVQQSSK